jgi:hypothetical protein
MIAAFALIKVSPLYAAEASTFCLDTKVAKKSRRKKPSALKAYAWPRFFVGPALVVLSYI